MTGGRGTSPSSVSSFSRLSYWSRRSSSAVRSWTTWSSTPNSRASICAASSSSEALMVIICPMLFIIRRIISFARTPIASERLRRVIGGSISAWLLRTGASWPRPPFWPFRPPRRPRPSSSDSPVRADAGWGEEIRRSLARSFRLARRPARSAGEPIRPAAFFFSSSSSIGGWTRGGRCRRSRGRVVGCRRGLPARRDRRGHASAAGRGREGPRTGARRRVRPGRCWVPGARPVPGAGGASTEPPICPACIIRRISSGVNRRSGRWLLASEGGAWPGRGPSGRRGGAVCGAPAAIGGSGARADAAAGRRGSRRVPSFGRFPWSDWPGGSVDGGRFIGDPDAGRRDVVARPERGLAWPGWAGTRSGRSGWRPARASAAGPSAAAAAGPGRPRGGACAGRAGRCRRRAWAAPSGLRRAWGGAESGAFADAGTVGPGTAETRATAAGRPGRPGASGTATGGGVGRASAATTGAGAACRGRLGRDGGGGAVAGGAGLFATGAVGLMAGVSGGGVLGTRRRWGDRGGRGARRARPSTL